MKNLILAALLLIVAQVATAADDFDLSIVDSRTDKDKVVVLLTLGTKEYRLLVKKSELESKQKEIDEWVQAMEKYEKYGKRRTDYAQ